MMIYGNRLPLHLQAEVKARYVHRFLNKKLWRSGAFDDDKWLASTEFHVTKDGQRLDGRFHYCWTHSTASASA